MATGNFFDILGDDDNDDPSQLIASQKVKVSAKKLANAVAAASAGVVAKLPSKPLPPAQAGELRSKFCEKLDFFSFVFADVCLDLQ